MSESELKVDGNSISASSARLQAAADQAQGTTASALQRADHLAGTAGHQVFASLVDGVFDTLRAQLPNDIERLVVSYANGLLEISNAAGATDRALSASARSTGDGLQGGSITLQAAGGATLLTGGPVVQTWTTGTDPTAPVAAAAPTVAPPQDAESIYGTGASGAAAAGTAYAASAGIHSDFGQVYKGGYDEYQADRWGAQAYNCTSWAAFRRSQLDPSIPAPTGAGWQMASRVGEVPPSQAHLGSLVSLPPTPTNADGHVMVVEKVIGTDPPRFIVSHMNYDYVGGEKGGSISTDSTLTYTDGKWILTNPEANTTQTVGTPTFSS
jgi:surface antigen